MGSVASLSTMNGNQSAIRTMNGSQAVSVRIQGKGPKSAKATPTFINVSGIGKIDEIAFVLTISVIK